MSRVGIGSFASPGCLFVAILDRDAEISQPITDRIGQLEILLRTGFGPQVDQQLHQFVGQGVSDVVGHLDRRLPKNSQQTTQFSQQGHRRRQTSTD